MNSIKKIKPILEKIITKNTKDSEYLYKGYYYVNELLAYLLIGSKITTYGLNGKEFGEIIGRTRATVRIMVVEGRVINLIDGYYNKDKLIKFLLERSNIKK